VPKIRICEKSHAVFLCRARNESGHHDFILCPGSDRRPVRGTRRVLAAGIIPPSPPLRLMNQHDRSGLSGRRISRHLPLSSRPQPERNFTEGETVAATWLRAVNAPVARWLHRLSRADWLDRNRIVAWGSILLTLEVLFLGFMVLWHHDVFGRIDPPTSTDFVSFYAAGKLALAGTPALAYDQAAHAAAEVAATAPGISYQFFFYPPVYLFLCAPLALLPYMVGFLLFQAVTLGAWLLVMRRILGSQGWAWCLLLAYPAVFWTLGIGQNSFLTAALLGAMTLLLDERPLGAGVLLGMLCYKPHLALLAPVALAAGKRWRTMVAAAVTVAVIVGLSVALFGFDTWRDYLTALAGSQAVYETGRIDLAAFVTPYGAARVLGAGARTAQLLQAVTSLLVAIAVGWIWRRDPGPAERSAALAAGILLSVPLALIYDLMLLTVAIGWLVRASRGTGFLPWEKLALFFCFLVPLVSRHLGQATHIPIAPLAPAALLALCLVRTLKQQTLAAFHQAARCAVRSSGSGTAAEPHSMRRIRSGLRGRPFTAGRPRPSRGGRRER
jgi:alpha-1,2-mannosyltransferase